MNPPHSHSCPFNDPIPISIDYNSQAPTYSSLSTGLANEMMTPVALESQSSYLPKKETDRVVLNARGTRYEMRLDSFNYIPSSRLFKLKNYLMNEQTDSMEILDTLCDGYDPKLNEFYFNVDPYYFGLVLKFYEKSPSVQKTHINMTTVCPFELEQCMESFGIDVEKYLDKCCLCLFDESRENIFQKLEAERRIVKEFLMKDDFGPYCASSIREKIWDLMEKPLSSRWATIYNLFSAFMIIVSIIQIMLRSVPQLNDPSDSANPYDEPRNWFDVTEGILVGWFTIELFIRFFVCPNHLTYFLDFFPLCDLISVVPYYVYLIFWYVDAIALLKNICRVFRIMRFIRVFRMNQTLNALLETTSKSAREISIYFLFLFLATLVFSTMVYYLENYNENSTVFYSIPGSFWWAVITMTTVGYGDTFPETVPGKVVGVMCATCGVVILAMPIGLLTNNFSSAFRESQFKKKVIQSYMRRLDVVVEKKEFGFFQKFRSLRTRLETKKVPIIPDLTVD